MTTVLSDVILPNRALSAGLRGKPMRKNSRVVTDSGRQYANADWSQSLRQYEVGFVPCRADAREAITAIHEVTAGGVYGFLLQDPIDHSVTATTGRMTLVSGSIYQLQKRYSVASTAHYEDRKITRPNAAIFTPYYDGVAIETYILDADTGQITLAAPVADASLLSWVGQFYVPVHFMDDFLDWDLVAPGSPDQRFVATTQTILLEVRE